MKIFCTTPKKVSADIQLLCDKVVPGSEPQLVNVIAAEEAFPGECFYNVEKHVQKFGGKSVIGWQLWEWPGVFAEAEFHAVWEDPDGTLLDITPKADGETSTLFFPDPSRKYEEKRVANIKHPIAKGELVRDYIKLLDLGFEVVENFSTRVNPVMVHYGSMLEQATQVVRAMLVKGRTTKGKCVCGGHLTYGDCHRNEVKDTIEALAKMVIDLKK